MHIRRWPGEALRFTAWMLALWLALAVPAYAFAGPAGLEGSAWALLLCVVPGCATLIAADRLDDRRRPVFGMLIGTGLRLFLTAGGALAVALGRPGLRIREFFVWLIVFYLVALLVETRMLLAGRVSRPRGPAAGLPADMKVGLE